MSAPRPGRWTAKPSRARFQYMSFHMAGTMVYLAVVFGYIATHSSLNRSPTFLPPLNGVILILASILYLLNEVRIRQVTQADLARTERPEGLAEFLVEIEIRTTSESLGNDRGVIYFENGLLGFIGNSTSFLLEEGDLFRPTTKFFTEWDRLSQPLPILAGKKEISVKIRPLLGCGRPYRKALKAFLREKKVTDAQRQWPPTLKWGQEPEPEKPVETWTPPPLPASDLSHLDCETLEERAQLALRLGYVGEYQRVRDELETRAGV